MDRNAIILIDEAWEKELPGMVLPSMRIIAMKLRNYVEVPQGKDIYLKDVLRDLENLAHKNVNILESNMIYMINPRDDTLSPTAPLVEEIDVSAEKFFSILKTMTETAAGHTGEWAAYAHGREQTVVSNTRHSMVSQIRDYQEVTGLMKSAWMLEGLIYNLYFTVMQWVKQDREIAQLLKLLRKVTIILPGLCSLGKRHMCKQRREADLREAAFDWYEHLWANSEPGWLVDLLLDGVLQGESGELPCADCSLEGIATAGGEPDELHGWRFAGHVP